MSDISKNDNESWWQETFLIEMVDPETLERTSILHVKRWKLVTGLVVSVILVIVLTYALVGFTPLRKLLPADYSQVSVQEIVQLRSRMEEMERVLGEQDTYISSLQGLLSGKPVDSLQHEEVENVPTPDTQVKALGVSEEEIQLR